MSDEKIEVMVVEDEVLIGLMLAKKLRASGYEVGDVVTTGEDAVQSAGKNRPSAVLMDVTLAGRMTGIEAAQQIRDKYAIPIIFFTGYNDRLIHDQARQVDPVAILAKMDPIADIIAAIRTAVS
jgi:CheY-like chemotaxis protein